MLRSTREGFPAKGKHYKDRAIMRIHPGRRHNSHRVRPVKKQ